MIKIAILLALATVGLAKHHHKHKTPQADPSVEDISFECTYRCGIWNTCMVRGAIIGNTAACGSEPSGCQCVWAQSQ